MKSSNLTNQVIRDVLFTLQYDRFPERVSEKHKVLAEPRINTALFTLWDIQRIFLCAY